MQWLTAATHSLAFKFFLRFRAHRKNSQAPRNKTIKYILLYLSWTCCLEIIRLYTFRLNCSLLDILYIHKYISQLAWEDLCFPPDELYKLISEREVLGSFFRVLAPPPRPGCVVEAEWE